MVAGGLTDRSSSAAAAAADEAEGSGGTAAWPLLSISGGRQDLDAAVGEEEDGRGRWGMMDVTWAWTLRLLLSFLSNFCSAFLPRSLARCCDAMRWLFVFTFAEGRGCLPFFNRLNLRGSPRLGKQQLLKQGDAENSRI
jgi:hypothetical protein